MCFINYIPACSYTYWYLYVRKYWVNWNVGIYFQFFVFSITQPYFWTATHNLETMQTYVYLFIVLEREKIGPSYTLYSYEVQIRPYCNMYLRCWDPTTGPIGSMCRALNWEKWSLSKLSNKRFLLERKTSQSYEIRTTYHYWLLLRKYHGKIL